jgi:hypothetical protein
MLLSLELDASLLGLNEVLADCQDVRDGLRLVEGLIIDNGSADSD